MTEYGLFTLFLFLHIGAAIIAFGPSFAFPIIGAMAGKEPMHGNFATRVNEALEDRLVLPFAISMPFTGVFLIWFGHTNLLDRSDPVAVSSIYIPDAVRPVGRAASLSLVYRF